MKTRIIYSILLVCTFYVFYTQLSENLLMDMSTFLAWIGGILCAFFLIQAVAGFRSLYEVQDWYGTPKAWYHRLGLFMIPSVIVFITVFCMHYNKLEDQVILKYGKMVEGTITNGRSKTSKYESSIYLSVSYYTPKGEYISTKLGVTSQQFEAARKDMPVEILYCSKYPSRSKIIVGEDMIERFTTVKNRLLTLKDLTTMLDLPGDSVRSYINRVSYRWITVKEYPYYLINSSEDLEVVFSPGKKIVYSMRNTKYYEPILQEIKYGKYEEVPGETRTISYVKDSIGIILEMSNYDIKSTNVNGNASTFPGVGVGHVVTVYKL